VSKQVQQMVQFIRQEAEEKANEIAVTAEEVCGRLCSSQHPVTSSELAGLLQGLRYNALLLRRNFALPACSGTESESAVLKGSPVWSFMCAGVQHREAAACRG